MTSLFLTCSLLYAFACPGLALASGEASDTTQTDSTAVEGCQSLEALIPDPHRILSEKVRPFGYSLGPFPLSRTSRSVVYAAQDTQGNPAVIKFTDPKTAERERRWLKELSTSSDPDSRFLLKGIPPYGSDDFVFLERAEKSLQTALAKGEFLSYRNLWPLQLARGVAALHKRNIVHADLKTSNIFITQDGEIRIGDFGISVSAGQRHLGGTPGRQTENQRRRLGAKFSDDLPGLRALILETGISKDLFEEPRAKKAGLYRQDPENPEVKELLFSAASIASPAYSHLTLPGALSNFWHVSSPEFSLAGQSKIFQSAKEIADFLQIAMNDKNDLLSSATWYHAFKKLDELAWQDSRLAATALIKSFGELGGRFHKAPIAPHIKTRIILNLHQFSLDGHLPDGTPLHPAQTKFVEAVLNDYGRENLKLALAPTDFWQPRPGRNGFLSLLRPLEAPPGEPDELPEIFKIPRHPSTYLIDSHGRVGSFTRINHRGEVLLMSAEEVASLLRGDPQFDRTSEIFMTQCFSATSGSGNALSPAQRLADQTNKTVIASRGHTKFIKTGGKVYLWVEDEQGRLLPFERAFVAYPPGSTIGQDVPNPFAYLRSSSQEGETVYAKPVLTIPKFAAPIIGN